MHTSGVNNVLVVLVFRYKYLIYAASLLQTRTLVFCLFLVPYFYILCVLGDSDSSDDSSESSSDSDSDSDSDTETEDKAHSSSSCKYVQLTRPSEVI